MWSIELGTSETQGCGRGHHTGALTRVCPHAVSAHGQVHCCPHQVSLSPLAGDERPK